MTREDIIRMALEAGCWKTDTGKLIKDDIGLTQFAALVAAAEREACAAICDRFQARDVGMQPAECAGAIRARGQA